MKKVAFLVVASFALFSFTSEIDQLIKAKLSVVVLDKTGNPVEGALIKLFLTEEDFLKKENEATYPQVTNKKGKTLFTGLQEISYYMYVEKGDLDNMGSGIKTDTLSIAKINKVRTIVTDL